MAVHRMATTVNGSESIRLLCVGLHEIRVYAPNVNTRELLQ